MVPNRAACLAVALTLAAAAQSSDFFETNVRPVLVKNCYSCHATSAMGGLRLDSREQLQKGGHDGPVVIPGDPDNSLLIQAVRRTHARIKMPPQGKLTDQEIGNLASWVKAGAVWPASAPGVPAQRDFWAFQPVRKPTQPATIDGFILARLEEKGLHPVRPASKEVLIRRATFDLTGLPPTPKEIDNFLNDSAPSAFAKVVDRLLASPHYGERWGRYWLDLARYADGQLGASKDAPYKNAYRYRDWVIQALNDDMPYDQFAKAQIAGDQLDNTKLLPALGFYALGPGDDDRVDVTGQVFLGLTVGCARCHDHKYDPIATRDFYSLLGVFKSTENHDYPLAPEAAVEAYKWAKKEIEEQKYAVDDFVQKHSTELSEILATKTARYMMAAWDVLNGREPDAGLDATILKRWTVYLKAPGRDHKFLDKWDQLLAGHASREQMQKFAAEFQDFALAIFADKHAMDEHNFVKMGGTAGVRDERTRQYTNLESLPIEKYYLWRDLASEPYKKDFLDFKGGVYYFGPKDIDRFLAPEWREHHQALNARLAKLKQEMPAQYPFLHTIRDTAKPADIKVYIRGDEATQGEVAPRRFLPVLCNGEPELFKNGSGRLELAKAIASAANPLFARVMVNRIWQHHFGQGLVRTPSNFGQLGERPTHPELLDYLAASLVDHQWSIKALHREIMLSATYQLSADEDPRNVAEDPANLLLWRANLQPRLDWEALRDALLAVSGQLDPSIGGPPTPLSDANRRRSIYSLIGRTKPDSLPALFDFPNPNATSEQRLATVGPMQRLFFMNNSFVALQANALSDRLTLMETDDRARITQAYRLLFGRAPAASELQLGIEFLEKNNASWPQYTQVLLSSVEFSSVQ